MSKSEACALYLIEAHRRCAKRESPEWDPEPLAAYRSGFLLMLSWTVLAAILITFTRETYCQPSRDQA